MKPHLHTIYYARGVYLRNQPLEVKDISAAYDVITFHIWKVMASYMPWIEGHAAASQFPIVAFFDL